MAAFFAVAQALLGFIAWTLDKQQWFGLLWDPDLVENLGENSRHIRILSSPNLTTIAVCSSLSSVGPQSSREITRNSPRTLIILTARFFSPSTITLWRCCLIIHSFFLRDFTVFLAKRFCTIVWVLPCSLSRMTDWSPTSSCFRSGDG